MSGQIIIENGRLTAEVSTSVKTIIVVENGTLDALEIKAPEGVAFDLNKETGEVSLSSNSAGTFDVTVGFEGEEPQDIIVLEVTAAETVTTESSETPAPEITPEPTPEPTPAAPVVEEKKVEEKPVAPVAKPSQKAKANNNPFSVPDTMVKETAELMNVLNDYKVKMSLRSAVTKEAGIVHQANLLRAMLRVLNKEGKEFTVNMNALVQFVKENRQDCFSERAVNRFMQYVKMNKDEQQLFTRLTTLLMITADIEDKKLITKQIDFKFIEDKLKNGAAMQRLRHYYNPATE